VPRGEVAEASAGHDAGTVPKRRVEGSPARDPPQTKPTCNPADVLDDIFKKHSSTFDLEEER
jgi:hypothetical protein